MDILVGFGLDLGFGLEQHSIDTQEMCLKKQYCRINNLCDGRAAGAWLLSVFSTPVPALAASVVRAGIYVG